MTALVTLTTDFGTRDAYVAQLKGVLYARGPSDLRVVDLSHELSPQDVHEAALFVRAALPTFPRGTIHVVVVDPGVGSTRRALCVELHEQLLLAPDNGVLSLLFDGSERAFTLEPERVTKAPLSATFHGRDLFAPAAALLASGRERAALGSPMSDPVRIDLPEPRTQGSVLHGEVLLVDRFGNAITNLTRSALLELAQGDELASLSVAFGAHDDIAVVRTYADAAPGALCALVGSGELLEIAARDAAASALAQLARGHEIRVTRRSRARRG